MPSRPAAERSPCLRESFLPAASFYAACDEVHDLDISGLRATAPAEGKAVIALHEASDVFVHGSKASKETPTFVQVSGASSTGIMLLGTTYRMLYSQSPSRMGRSWPLSHCSPELAALQAISPNEPGEHQAYAKYSIPSYVSCPHVVLRPYRCSLRAACAVG